YAFRKHTGPVNALAFSPDNKWIASGGDDRVVHVWEPLTGNEQTPLKGHVAGVWQLAFSRNGNRLASTERPGRSPAVRLWDVKPGRSIMTVTGRGAVAVNHDGSRV